LAVRGDRLALVRTIGTYGREAEIDTLIIIVSDDQIE
jgi:hypothetical protein